MIELFALNKEIPFEKKENDLLCIGELLVDLIASDYDEKITDQAFYPYFGGSPANIAINSKRLGLNSEVVATVGEDKFGDYLVEHLKKVSLSTEYVTRSSHSTSMVVLNRSKTTPIPTFYRDADYLIDYTPKIQQLLTNSSILHLSSWSVSKLRSRLAVQAMIIDAKKQGMLIGFDPNFHHGVWNEGEDPKKDFVTFLEQVDVIKPSLDDAERIFGKGDAMSYINKFFDYGVKLVILTLGSDGVIVSNGKETLHYPTLATDVIDTTGAGDAFWSGFYTGIVNKMTIEQAVKIGLAVSAYKLAYIGAMAPLPKFEDIINQYQL